MSMVLILHIGIALLSMAWAGYTFISPSRTKLSVSYSLMAATLGTGIYLVVISPSHMVQACLVGVGYLAVTASATLVARRKLKLAADYRS